MATNDRIDESRKSLRTRLEFEVRAAIRSEAQILASIPEQIRESLGGPYPQLLPELEECVRRAAEAQNRRQAEWNELGVNDRIDSAFDELNERGITAVQDAGWTMTEGWDRVETAIGGKPGVRGAVFYHTQDLERAVDGLGLKLAFDAFPFGGPDEPAVAIGTEVCLVLKLHGVETHWSGALTSRIQIPPFEWRKRSP